MAKHAFTLAELEALVCHVNSLLGKDGDLECMPIKPSQKLFHAQKSGVLFCKLLNRVKRGSVPPSKINKAVKNIHQALENQNLVIEGAKYVGCEVHKISAEDLWSGKEYLVLGILWQIVKAGLLSHVNVNEHPELAILRKSSENWAEFSKLPPEEPLRRWVNYHLRQSNYRGLDMRDFAGSLKDSVIYCHLLKRLAPERCSLSPLVEDDLFVRAKRTLQMAETIGCRKYLTAHELVKGNPRLNLAFLANLFHVKPGLSFFATEMDTVRLTDELNTALSRCQFDEEERNVLLQERKEILDELKDTRKKLEDSLKEMEILKKRASRLEDENKHFTGVEEMLELLKGENELLQNQLDDMKAVESDSQAIIKNQETTISSLKNEKEVLTRENADKVSELENKLTTASRKQTTLVLQKEAITHERDLLKRKHDKCETAICRLQAQVDRRQRHVQQLRQLYKSFTSDKTLAETLYGMLDTNSLQKVNGKDKAIQCVSRDGGRCTSDMSSRLFLLKDNFLFVYDVEKEDEPQEILRLDQATVEKDDSGLVILKFTQKEIWKQVLTVKRTIDILIPRTSPLAFHEVQWAFSYFIKVSPTSQLKDLLQELEISSDWWTDRQRTSPGFRFKEVVRTNLLSNNGSKQKLNLKHTPFITADV